MRVFVSPCRLRDPSARLSWRESSFLSAMTQNQSAQTADLFSQDVFNQLFDMLDQCVKLPDLKIKKHQHNNRLKWGICTAVHKTVSPCCCRASPHADKPIELNFTESPTDGSAGNTIQISMDCITMHEPHDTLSVSTWRKNSHFFSFQQAILHPVTSPDYNHLYMSFKSSTLLRCLWVTSCGTPHFQ